MWNKQPNEARRLTKSVLLCQKNHKNLSRFENSKSGCWESKFVYQNLHSSTQDQPFAQPGFRIATLSYRSIAATSRSSAQTATLNLSFICPQQDVVQPRPTIQGPMIKEPQNASAIRPTPSQGQVFEKRSRVLVMREEKLKRLAETKEMRKTAEAARRSTMVGSAPVTLLSQVRIVATRVAPSRPSKSHENAPKPRQLTRADSQDSERSKCIFCRVRSSAIFKLFSCQKHYSCRAHKRHHKIAQQCMTWL